MGTQLLTYAWKLDAQAAKEECTFTVKNNFKNEEKKTTSRKKFKQRAYKCFTETGCILSHEQLDDHKVIPACLAIPLIVSVMVNFDKIQTTSDKIE